MQSALNAATQVAANESATQDAIDEAAQALLDAISKMKTVAKETAENNVAADIGALSEPVIGTGDTFTLVTEGANGSTITWTSSGDAISIDGATATVNRGRNDVYVILKATVTYGTGDDMVSDTKTFTVTVMKAVPPKTDKTELAKAIADAEKFTSGEDYTRVTWTALQTALKEAKKVQEDLYATQEEITEKTGTLTSAISNLKTVAKETAENNVAEDKKELKQPEIGTGATFELVTVGWNGSTITWTSNHKAIVVDGATAAVTRQESAVDVILTATITYGTGNDAATDTRTFTVTVPAKDGGENPPAADKTKLDAAIAEAEAITGEDTYTEITWAALQKALGEARDVSKATDAAQDEVDEKESALRDAIANLKTKAKETAEKNVASDKDAIEQPVIGTGDTITLPIKGEKGSTISWKSNHKAIVVDGATAAVTRQESAVDVILTATITYGTGNDAVTDTRTFTVTVPAKDTGENPPAADKAKLDAAIAEAEAITGEDTYTEITWAALQKALGEAKSVSETEDAAQDEVDAKESALREAIGNLKTKAKETAEKNVASDKDAIEQPVIGTGDTIALPIEGEKGSTISWKSNHKAIVVDGATAAVTRQETAVDVILTATITYGTGNDAVTDTRTFTVTVPAKDTGENPPAADKTKLNEAIAEAEAITGEDTYTEITWDALQKALGEAKRVSEAEDAAQSEVDEKESALRDAIDNLKTKAKETAENNVAADKEILENLESLKNPEFKIGDTITLPAGGENGCSIIWESDNEAIQIDGDTAKVMGADTETTVTLTATITYGEGDDAVEETVSFEIKVAAKNPAASVDKTALGSLIQKAQGYVKGNYTDDSWKVFQDALKAAQDAYNDSEVSQSIVDSRRTTLESAMNNLKVKTVKTDISKASVTLSSASYTYNKKAQQPKVTVKLGNKALRLKTDYTVSYKNNVQVGKASVIITGAGNYSGTVTKTFDIVPKGTSISGKITTKSKSFTVKWKKAAKSEVTGYEVQYSMDKKFKKGAKTKAVKKASVSKLTVKKLKPNKKYYVRIRTYKTVKGKKFVSKWSKAKYVKIKK